MTRDPDHPVYRRRALAARAVSFAEYSKESLDLIVKAAAELGAPVPLEVATFPKVLKEWADTVERKRP